MKEHEARALLKEAYEDVRNDYSGDILGFVLAHEDILRDKRIARMITRLRDAGLPIDPPRPITEVMAEPPAWWGPTPVVA